MPDLHTHYPVVVIGGGQAGLAMSAQLKARGILANGVGDRRMRVVTHCDVSREDCARALEAIRLTVLKAVPTLAV